MTYETPFPPLTARDVIRGIGYSRCMAALGVNQPTLSMAIKRGRLPSAWFPHIRQLAQEAGVPAPEHLFAWRPPLEPLDDEAAPEAKP